jgi:hypothetical protein
LLTTWGWSTGLKVKAIHAVFRSSSEELQSVHQFLKGSLFTIHNWMDAVS